MSFRAIYIIDPKAREKSKKVLFKRVFPVIEKKCERCSGAEKYQKIPVDFPNLILEELQLLRNKDEFIPKFDSCARELTHPVYSLLDGALYPIVAFQKAGFVYACVVWDGEEIFEKTKLIIDSPGVIFGLTVLENMAKAVDKDNTLTERKLELLHKYVSVGFPFGVPTELDINCVLAMVSTAEGVNLPKTKGPAWRPIAFKGKQTLHLKINEYVRGIQFDHNEIPDKCEVYGTVTCKADVEESPEVSLNFFSPVESKTLKQMAYHPSVQYLDDLPSVVKSDANGQKETEFESQKIRFCPPYDEFELCHYKASLPQNDFPVKAFYQMKGSIRSAKVMIQLNLSSKMKNDFESFDVHIPFFNRGPILDLTCLTSSANVYVLSDKATLLWSIGTKFPGKSSEFTLNAEVTFGDESAGVVKPHKYLHGQNAFIRVLWTASDFTYSGLVFDAKSVELFPSSKVKISSASTFKTTEYKVWNSHGDVTETTFAS